MALARIQADGFFNKIMKTYIQWFFCLLILGGDAVSAQFMSPAAVPEHWYIFMADTSLSMARLEDSLRKAVFDLVDNGVEGRMRAGDPFTIWTFNDEVYTRKFVPTNWDPALNRALANGASNFMKGQRFDKTTRLDRAVSVLWQAARATSTLTALILSDGGDVLQGTVFDRQINDIYRQRRAELRRLKQPFVTVLVFQDGRLASWSVKAAGEFVSPVQAKPVAANPVPPQHPAVPAPNTESTTAQPPVAAPAVTAPPVAAPAVTAPAVAEPAAAKPPVVTPVVVKAVEPSMPAPVSTSAVAPAPRPGDPAGEKRQMTEEKPVKSAVVEPEAGSRPAAAPVVQSAMMLPPAPVVPAAPSVATFTPPEPKSESRPEAAPAVVNTPKPVAPSAVVAAFTPAEPKSESRLESRPEAAPAVQVPAQSPPPSARESTETTATTPALRPRAAGPAEDTTRGTVPPAGSSTQVAEPKVLKSGPAKSGVPKEAAQASLGIVTDKTASSRVYLLAACLAVGAAVVFAFFVRRKGHRGGTPSIISQSIDRGTKP